MNAFSVTLYYLRSTKRTHVYSAGAITPSVNSLVAPIETLYIDKIAFNGLEPPKSIIVGVQEAK